MKSGMIKKMALLLAILVMPFAGCRTVVTDVNAVLSANGLNEELGTPVKYNENHIEVALNPVEDETLTENETDMEDNTQVAQNTEEDTNKPEEDEKEIKSEDSDNEDTEDTENEDEDNPDEDDSDSEDEDGLEDEDNGDEDESDEKTLEEQMAADNFDPVYYAENNPDVVAIYGDSPEALYKHYLDYGKAEGRKCHADD